MASAAGTDPPAPVDAADPATHPGAPEGTARTEEVAATIGAMVAEDLRRLLEPADHAGRDEQPHGPDDPPHDRDATHRLAVLLLARIDFIEAGVAEILHHLREETQRIADQAHIAPATAASEALPPEADRGPEAPPDGAASDDAFDTAEAVTDDEPEDETSTPGRGRRLLRRRREPAPIPRCAICGRTPEDVGGDDRTGKGWRSKSELTICPDCRAEGWR